MCGTGTTTTIFPDINNFPLASQQCAIEDRELTLGPGETLCAKTGFQNAIDFVISGIERDA
jgi:hypothetical protein